MDTIELAQRVVDEKQAHLWRYREGQMQARPYGGGSKRGWVVLDLFSAGHIVAVADAINETNRAKLAAMTPTRAALLCLELISKQKGAA